MWELNKKRGNCEICHKEIPKGEIIFTMRSWNNVWKFHSNHFNIPDCKKCKDKLKCITKSQDEYDYQNENDYQNVCFGEQYYKLKREK